MREVEKIFKNEGKFFKIHSGGGSEPPFNATIIHGSWNEKEEADLYVEGQIPRTIKKDELVELLKSLSGEVIIEGGENV